MTTRGILPVVLCLSAGLHAALLALPGRDGSARRVEAVDVEMRVVPLPTPAPAPAAPPAAPGAPAVTRPSDPPRHRGPAARDALPVPPDAAPSAAGGDLAVAAPASPDPRASTSAPAAGGGADGSGSGASARGPGGDGHDPAGTGTDLLAGYVRRLQEALKRHFEYPRRAQRQGLQGRVVVRVVIDEAGAQRGVRVATSSGHDVLDEAAQNLVRQVRFPAPPPELHWGAREVELPVDYTLE